MKLKCYQVDVWHEGVEAPFEDVNIPSDTKMDELFPPEFFMVGVLTVKVEAYLVHLPAHLRCDMVASVYPDTFVAVLER